MAMSQFPSSAVWPLLSRRLAVIFVGFLYIPKPGIARHFHNSLNCKSFRRLARELQEILAI
jgi:hypothetical protein